MKANLLIYDLDGTLVDTREDIERAANHMLAEMGKPALPPGGVSPHVGRGLFNLVSGCLKTSDRKEIERGAKIYRAHYAEHMLDHSRLYDGARDLLEHFRGRKQAVITNKPNPFAENILRELGVADYFVEIVAGDSAYPKKPDPASVLAIMRREGASAAETLFIGDSEIDVLTGRNAGIRTAVVCHGFGSESELKSAAPDALVRDFGELLNLAKKEGW